MKSHAQRELAAAAECGRRAPARLVVSSRRFQGAEKQSWKHAQHFGHAIAHVILHARAGGECLLAPGRR